MKSTKRNKNSLLSDYTYYSVIIVALIVMVVGGTMLVRSNAATPSAALEAESGTISGNASKVSDGLASGGVAIKFGSGTVTTPTPTPSPTPSPSSGNGHPAYTLNYDTCTTTQWADTSAVGGGLTPVSSPVHQGKCAMKVVVHSGDKPSSSGERAESLNKSSGMYSTGDHSFTAWSTMFPVGWSQIPDSGYQIFTQWHGTGDTLSPPVSYRIASKGLELRLRGGSTDTNIKDYVISSSPSLGKWNDFVEETHWSGTSSGSITVWHRVEGGAWQKAVSLTGVATTHGHPVYLRQGLYRSPFSATNTLYHDGTLSGPTMNDIAGAFADGKTP